MDSWRTSPRVPMVLVIVIIFAVLGGIAFTLSRTSLPSNLPGGEPTSSAGSTSPSPDSDPFSGVSISSFPPHYVVNNLHVISESTADPHDRRSVSFAVPNSDKPNVASPDSFTALLTEQAAAWQDLYDSQIQDDEASNELNISWQINAASGGILGERLTYYDFTAGVAGQRHIASFFTELGSGDSWPAADLLAPSARDTVLQAWQGLYSEVPGGHNPRDAGSGIDPADVVLTDLTLRPNGHVILGLPPAVFAPESAGHIWLDFDADSADLLLSPLGKKLREQVSQGPTFGIESHLGELVKPSPEAPTQEPSQEPTEEPTDEPTQDPTEEPADDEAAVDCTQTKCVALTFDDGPSEYTTKILGHLAERGARASFFVVGKNAQIRPQELAKIFEGGHEIGNHTLSHGDLTKYDAKRIKKEIDATNEPVKSATGITPTLTRPPYGAVNSSVQKTLGDLGQTVVLWDVDSEDWLSRDTKAITTGVLDAVKPGSIVLMHDIHPETAKAIPKIIDELQAQGYELVTVSELLGDTEPGKKYFNGPRG